jgi:hypothetical protein
MRWVVHLGRAAVVFWVAAILLPGAVTDVVAGSATRQGAPSAHAALTDLSGTAGEGLTGVSDAVARVDAAEEDVRRVVARVRLEVERFIAGLP